MKYTVSFLVALFMGLHLQSDPKVQNPPQPNTHRFQLGPDIFWSHFRSGSYRDEDGIKFKATVNGYYGGLRAGYDYLQPDAFYAGTEAIVAWGRDHIQQKSSESLFATSSCNCCTPHTRHEHHSRLWVNVEQRLGYNAQSTVLLDFIVTPYFGIGAHYESSSSAHAYWYYAAGGLKTLQKFYDRFELGFDFKAMFAFDIHDHKFVLFITTQDKKTFWGFETAIPLRWLLGTSGRWDFELKPYLLKLNLNSPQTIVGVRFMMGYGF